MPEQIHILMTGGGAPGAPGIIKCLLQDSRVRLTVADADNGATGRYLHPQFVHIPKATAPDFAQQLLLLCQQQKVQVVLPLVTKELLPLAQNKQLFAQAGIKLLVSNQRAIELSNDKSACYRFLNEKGIAVPKFFVANTIEDFTYAASAMGYPAKDFCFKPSQSNGSRGFRIVSNVINESELLFTQKPYNTYITYAQAQNILSSQPFPQLLVSEYLPGEEYSVDCLANEGKTVMAVPRLRTKMVNGISVQGRFVKDDAIINYCSTIIEAIGLHGNIGIQIKFSADGEPLLLEINPRVQGTIVAGLGAGVNLPLLAVMQELEEPVPDAAFQVKWGTCFSRFWTEVFY